MDMEGYGEIWRDMEKYREIWMIEVIGLGGEEGRISKSTYILIWLV